jgi:hypothetical protein
VLGLLRRGVSRRERSERLRDPALSTFVQRSMFELYFWDYAPHDTRTVSVTTVTNTGELPSVDPGGAHAAAVSATATPQSPRTSAHSRAVPNTCGGPTFASYTSSSSSAGLARHHRRGRSPGYRMWTRVRVSNGCVRRTRRP